MVGHEVEAEDEVVGIRSESSRVEMRSVRARVIEGS